ncbi:MULTISPECIES: hypothetical protein [unclassified Vibrio]|uniref:hypothetical protein n=1 Tax=unclassified Vibrio TaxID=2614977 RepID=UPI00192982B8|nr:MULTISPECIES: hypothetical protein [unclassified Vibrio]
MANSVVIQQLNNQLKVNSDAYDLSRIVGVEVKVLTFKDHLLRMLLLGAISSSLLFIFIPSEHQEYGLAFASFLPFIAFLFGAFLGFVSSNKYEFRLEFNHLDGTGIQWFTAAKSRKASDYVLFKEQEIELKRKIT